VQRLSKQVTELTKQLRATNDENRASGPLSPAPCRITRLELRTKGLTFLARCAPRPAVKLMLTLASLGG